MFLQIWSWSQDTNIRPFSDDNMYDQLMQLMVHFAKMYVPLFILIKIFLHDKKQSLRLRPFRESGSVSLDEDPAFYKLKLSLQAPTKIK